MLNKKLLGSVSAPPAEYVEDVFSTWLYTGNGSTQTITNGIDLAGEGGLVWIKARNTTTFNCLFDTNRGGDNRLVSDTTNAQSTYSGNVTSFNSNGFSIGDNTQSNQNSFNYVSWTFREQPKFFDVVTYTGNGVNGRDIPHNLGSVPGMMIVKQTDAINDWAVYHRSVGNTKFLVLNTTAATTTSSAVWNNTTPTSTTFRVGNDAQVNGSGQAYVAYLFAHDAGGFGTAGTDNVISCGSFTTDGSGNATVSLGYEPQYILMKRSDSSSGGNWFVFDVMRGWNQTQSFMLNPNDSAAETTYSNNPSYITPTATGFKLDANFFQPSATYIYMAIRRPMKVPTTGTQVYNAISRSGTSANATISNVGFAPDFVISKASAVGTGYTPAAFTKLMGAKRFLFTGSTAAEATDNTSLTSFDQNGISIGNDSTNFGVINETGSVFINWFFKRASGFMDAVCYTGTGSARTVEHNLTVVPELMIVKRRSATNAWAVYANNDNTDYLVLNTDAATADDNTYWNDTTPTSTVFSVGTNNAVNASASTYVAYLFATVAGVSKVGSYTGNGSSQTINCGFSAGARFVLIKRTDSTGDWVTLDTTRGIVSGNDPFLQLNSASAEVTGEDIVDPANSGFIVNETTEAINTNAATYIFLAIA